MMRTRIALLAVTCIVAASPALPVGAAMPNTGNFDFNFCFVTDINHVALTDKAGLGSFTNLAAIHANPSGGAFDLQGARCFGYYSNVEGEYTESGYCEMKDADGDLWIMKFAGIADGTGGWNVAAGTGKYAGMSATGKYRPLGVVPSTVSGKVSRCNRNTGTYQLK
ncbi:MAG TPA: hypothetical protein VHB46_16175 [Burkholderiales bacterium]|nr:hypothetical protein [Burkholderiales bacterium]